MYAVVQYFKAPSLIQCSYPWRCFLAGYGRIRYHLIANGGGIHRPPLLGSSLTVCNAKISGSSSRIRPAKDRCGILATRSGNVCRWMVCMGSSAMSPRMFIIMRETWTEDESNQWGSTSVRSCASYSDTGNRLRWSTTSHQISNWLPSWRALTYRADAKTPGMTSINKATFTSDSSVANPFRKIGGRLTEHEQKI